MIDLDDFAASVGADGPVTITGLGTRGGAVVGVRSVAAPSGIDFVQPDEMIVCCGAATPVDELVATLAQYGQTVALPAGGTVGGALAVGRSDVRRLGMGPVRDLLLQARYVSAAAEVVKAGGPTVKNVSGFDLCRVLVGSNGSIGFLGEVLLRTRPLAAHSQWFVASAIDVNRAQHIFTSLYRPTSVLWDGASMWALVEGHPADVAEQAATCGLMAVDGPPHLPTAHRVSIAPRNVWSLTASDDAGAFVAEVGVGVVHSTCAVVESPAIDDRVRDLAQAVKDRFDPTHRLNPGR